MQRISLNELWSQYADEKMNFNQDSPVAVEMIASFEAFPEEKPEDLNRERLIKVKATAYHDQTNLNGSSISPETFLKATDSILLRPILANIVESEDGIKDFGAHDIRYEENEDGEMCMIFEEQPVGVIAGYSFEFDEEASVNRAVVEGYLYEDYASEALKVLRRRESVNCSVELLIRNMHYDSEEKQLVLDDYMINGLTLLGESHKPGMKGSSLSLYEEIPVKKPVEDEPVSESVEQIDGPVAPQPVAVDVEEPQIEQKTEEKAIETVSPSQDAEVEEPAEENEETEFCLASELVKANPVLAEKNFIYGNGSVVIFEDGCFKIASYSDENYELLDMVKGYFVDQDNYQNEVDALKAEIEELKAQLDDYRKAEEDAAKNEIMEDELYAPYLESDDFKAVISEMNSISSSEFASRMALAFSAVKRSEKKVNNVKPKILKQVNQAVISEKESRYGKLFASKTEKGE